VAEPFGLPELRRRVEDGSIDTVVVAVADLYGRLVGKRVTGEYFLGHYEQGLDACKSLLTLDMESDITPGYSIANLDLGYGDFLLHPDVSSLRLMPWHEGTALVLCDPRWFDGRPVRESPRAILAGQVERARALDVEPMFASELEFFLCRETYDESFRSHYDELTPSARYVTDSHLLAGGFDEPLIRQLRRGFLGARIPVEASKAEAYAGQHEITFHYGSPVATADHHVVLKHGAKEIAEQNGCSITFMAKPYADWIGSSCHVHSSLWRSGENLFRGESKLFRHYLAGQLACLRELAIFLAPTVNSYKRYVAGGWAGTTITWAHDNRTTGFRVIGQGDEIRSECRIPGADCNPYLAFAALLAAGLHGVEHELVLPEPYEGNAYEADVQLFPSTLREAIAALEQGTMARAVFGDAVVDHYLNFAWSEQRDFDRVVTDYEVARMFERG
jgi:glutamine synthetase